MERDFLAEKNYLIMEHQDGNMRGGALTVLSCMLRLLQRKGLGSYLAGREAPPAMAAASRVSTWPPHTTRGLGF